MRIRCPRPASLSPLRDASHSGRLALCTNRLPWQGIAIVASVRRDCIGVVLSCLLVAGGTVRAQTNDPPVLRLDEIRVVALPATFDLSGAFLGPSGDLVAWDATAARVIVSRSGRWVDVCRGRLSIPAARRPVTCWAGGPNLVASHRSARKPLECS
jgi:hypothetical protein